MLQVVQANFMSKALQNEVTEEGLRLLRRDGRFGPLQELFPEGGARWADAAGVNLDDCVAFRLDRRLR